MRGQRLWLSIILIYFAVAASLYAIQTPIFEASDEAEHFIYVHTILETDELPIIQSREEMANQRDPILRWNNQSHHAPLYYMTAALLSSWSDRADIADYLHPNELIFLRNTVEDNPNKWLHRYTEPTSDTHLALYVLRSLNILIGIGTLVIIYKTTCTITDNHWLPLLATLLTASIPTFIVVNSSVTNDALVIFLYSAGICWLLHVWQESKISWRDTIVISLILSGIALTKLTGVSLFGVIYMGLLAGIWQKRWGWQQVAQVMIASASAFSIFAGWWYLRNWTLYGDPFALSATASIWGREIPFALSMLPDELLRIGKSFWMMIGYLHFPVFAPDAFYIYMAVMTVIGLAGIALHFSSSKQRAPLWLMAFACLVVIGMLLYGTRSVDISYGRLLHPALAAFVPLLTIGIYQIFKRFSLLLILPLSLSAIVIPLTLIPNAYPSLQAITAVPDSATPVNWQADNLEIIAIEAPQNTVSAGDTIAVDIYLRGHHPTNPALTVTAVDTVRVARLDHIEIYPGMADMRYLPDEQVYKATIELDILQVDSILAPRVVNILVEWVDLVTNDALIFDSALSLLEVQSATFVDDRYEAPTLGNEVNINFGDEIILRDFSMPETAQAGDMLALSFVWEAINTMEDEAILTVQLFDSEGEFITQNDGVLWWYPTNRWAENVPFEDVRSLELPADLATGTYEIRVGWYRQEDDNYPRLSVRDEGSIDNLYVLPINLVVPE